MKKKFFHPDGRPFTKLEMRRMMDFSHVKSKLLETTVANRAGGMDEELLL
jgi:hypothetical protein